MFFNRNKRDDDDFGYNLNGEKKERPDRRRAKQYTKSVVATVVWFLIILLVAFVVLFFVTRHIKKNLQEEEDAIEYVVPQEEPEEEEPDDKEERERPELPEHNDNSDTENEEDNEDEFDDIFGWVDGILDGDLDDIRDRIYGDDASDNEKMDELYGILEDRGLGDIADEIRDRLAEENTKITVYFKEDTDMDTINTVQDAIKLYSSVDTVEYIAPESSDDEDNISGMLEIQLADDSEHDIIIEYLDNLPCVENVASGESQNEESQDEEINGQEIPNNGWSEENVPKMLEDNSSKI